MTEFWLTRCFGFESQFPGWKLFCAFLVHSVFGCRAFLLKILARSKKGSSFHPDNQDGCSSGRFPDTRALFEDSALCPRDRKSTRLNSSHMSISYAVFCFKIYNPGPLEQIRTSPYYPRSCSLGSCLFR